MNYIRQIIFIFIVVLMMIVALRVQITINESNRTKEEKMAENEMLIHENEKLKNELEAPMDDEYLEKVAEEKLDYKDPDKQYFYNDMPE